ncbi:MAG: hypothetical protein LLG42_14705 [Chloroflexi bacterium]|nr:hypothetical protein [Chloroflexota bacterium]
MRKMSWLGLVLFFSLLVYGCAGQSATPEATNIPTAENTEVAAVATETSLPTEVATEVVDCQPYNLLDEILPTENPNLPPVTEEGDHIKGPADAKLVILEYSDFQ